MNKTAIPLDRARVDVLMQNLKLDRAVLQERRHETNDASPMMHVLLGVLADTSVQGEGYCPRYVLDM